MGIVNKVILVGNRGADPEVKRTADNRVYCHLRVATSVVWKDKAGQRQEKTDWHRVTVWGDSAEHCGRYLACGRPVYIEGRLDNRQWQDKDGQKRYGTDVVANRVVFLGGGSGDRREGLVEAVQEDATPGGPGELFAVG